LNTELIKKFRKPGIIFSGVIGLYALLGFIMLPWLMQAQVPELIKSSTNRQSSFESIEFNPFSLELSLLGFSMQEKSSEEFVTFGEFYINVQVWESLFNMALVFDSVRLSKPYTRIEVYKDKSYNFSDLLNQSPDTQEKPKEASGIFPLIIHSLDISNGEVKVVDSGHKKTIVNLIQPLNLHINNFSTLLNGGAGLNFSMILNSGAGLKWQGDVGVNPLFSKGFLEVDGIRFSNVWHSFLQDRVNFKWVDGTQRVKFSYEFSYIEEEVLFNIFEGQLLTENLKFTAKQDNETLIDIPYFLLDGVEFDLKKQEILIQKIESKQANFKVSFNQAGELNYQTLFASKESKVNAENEDVQEAQQPWVIKVADLSLNASHINLRDQRPSEEILIDIASLDVGLKNYHLSTEKQLSMTANDGFLNLQTLNLFTQKDKDLLNVASFKVGGVDFSLGERKVNIKSITSSDALVNAWMAKSGELNYQGLFASEEKPLSQVEEIKKDKQEAPWLVTLDSFSIDNYALQFTDFSLKKPAELSLSKMHFSISDYSSKQGVSLPISFSTKLNKVGEIKLSGHSVIAPFSTELDVDIRQIEIEKFEPYLNESAKLDVIKGSINTKGKLAVTQGKQGELDLNYQGNVNVENLHTRDQILHQDFLRWKSLALKSLDFNLQPIKLNIKSVELDEPYARVTIKKDKSININDIFAEKKSVKKPDQTVVKNTVKPQFNIGSFQITEGSSDFSDYSLILPFVVKLNGLEGEINKISSNQKSETHIDLNGEVYDLSPVQIKGDLSPGLDKLDLGMHFSSFPLPFLSPYMVEFAGYKIEKGQMSLDLFYKVKDKQLTSQNNLYIDQLELGEEVESPDAVDLPLGLAIALLKDRNGKIEIKMPVSGSLDDPEFSVAPVVFDALLNVITKVISSPFTAIGSFLGSDEDFSVVNFQAGSAEITKEQGVKLDALKQALIKKPELSLDIEGGVYVKQDWFAMQGQALIDQLKQRRAEELKKQGEIKLAEYIKLSDDEYKRLLADLFIETYPEIAEKSIFGNPKLIYSDMGEFYTVAKNMLRSMIKPDNHKLFVLAATRSRNIARRLTADQGVEKTRVFILDGDIFPEAKDANLLTHLSLKAN